MRPHLLLLLLIATVTPAGDAVAGRAATFSSISVTLPSGEELFPAGPNAQAVNNNCLGCHSREMVLYQPQMTRSDWAKEVDKMRHAYKAPINDVDVGAIVDYLAAAKGRR